MNIPGEKQVNCLNLNYAIVEYFLLRVIFHGGAQKGLGAKFHQTH